MPADGSTSTPPPAQNSGGDERVEFNAAVEELLNTIQNKFAGISSEIFAKLDDMSSRLDKLEAELKASNAKDNNTSKS